MDIVANDSIEEYSRYGALVAGIFAGIECDSKVGESGRHSRTATDGVAFANVLVESKVGHDLANMNVPAMFAVRVRDSIVGSVKTNETRVVYTGER